LSITLKNLFFVDAIVYRPALVTSVPPLTGREAFLLKETTYHLERLSQLFRVALTAGTQQFTSGKTTMAFRFGINGLVSQFTLEPFTGMALNYRIMETVSTSLINFGTRLLLIIW
jgi:hypothetical protein